MTYTPRHRADVPVDSCSDVVSGGAFRPAPCAGCDDYALFDAQHRAGTS